MTSSESFDPFLQARRNAEAFEALARQIREQEVVSRRMYDVIVEQAEAARQAVAPLRIQDPLGETAAALRRQREVLAEPRRRVEAMLPPTDYGRHLAGIAQAARDAEARYRTMMAGGASVQEAVARVLRQTQDWERSLPRFDALFADVGAVDRQLQSVVGAYGTSVRQAVGLAETWQTAERQAALASQLLAPAQGFGRYAPAALARIAQAEPGAARDAGAASLALAEKQMAADSALQADLQVEVQAAAATAAERNAVAPAALGSPPAVTVAGPEEEMPDVTDAAGMAIMRVERFFLLQETEVRAAAAGLVAPDGRPAAKAVATARRFERRLDVARLTVVCNHDARMHRPGQAAPFAIGETVAIFFAGLGFFPTDARLAAGDFVDGLYVTLYEGTGEMRRLRPYLPPDAYAAVGRVKRIRNRLFRHNRERESPEVIARQAPETLRDLQALGLNGEPRNRSDYLRLHDGLVDDAIALLEALGEAIRK